jgi:hypothetical protein
MSNKETVVYKPEFKKLTVAAMSVQLPDNFTMQDTKSTIECIKNRIGVINIGYVTGAKPAAIWVIYFTEVSDALKEIISNAITAVASNKTVKRGR